MGTKLLNFVIFGIILGYANGQGCQVVHRETGEVLGKDPFQLRHKEDSPGIFAHFDIQGGTGVVQQETNDYCKSKIFSTSGTGTNSLSISYTRPEDTNFFDSGQVSDTAQAYFLVITLSCSAEVPVVLVFLEDANNQKPEWNLNGGSATIEVPRTLKAGDSLIPYYSTTVWAYDADRSTDTNGKVAFSIDSTGYTVAPLTSIAYGKNVYLPDIKLSRDATDYGTAQTAIVVTAKDMGVPSQSSSMTFTVIFMEAENILPPQFESPFYKSVISDLDFTGSLGTVSAVDGDGVFPVTYSLEDTDGLDGLSVSASTGVVSLTSVVNVGILRKKAVVALIKATESGAPNPKESVVPYIIILPDEPITTTLPPTTELTTIPTCPACPTLTPCPTQTEPTTTECPTPPPCPTQPECPTSPPCECTTQTECPTTTEGPTSPNCLFTTAVTPEPCSTAIPPTECPVCPTDAACTTCPACSTTTAATECPTTCPVCPTFPSESSTQTTCPTCPLECPTEGPGTTTISQCPTFPTECPTPVTCPDVNTCPACPTLQPGTTTMSQCPTCPTECPTQTTCPTCPLQCPTEPPGTPSSCPTECTTEATCPVCPDGNTCPACPTEQPGTTSISQCPTCPNECPTQTVCPICPDGNTCPTCSTEQPGTTTCPPVTECPVTCPTTATPTTCPLTCPPPVDCGNSSTMSTSSCPTCPPVSVCPTNPTTSCPTVTCPSVTVPTVTGGTCPPCTTTTEKPTTLAPFVQFERQSYSAEVIENVQGYNIVTVRASHTGGASVTYSLDLGAAGSTAIGKFTINSNTGAISTTQSLPTTPQSYLFSAVATAGGSADRTNVFVKVVPGANCGDPLFSEVLFPSDLKEGVLAQNFVQVTVANPTNVDYYISGVQPAIYEDKYFTIDNRTGYISAVKTVDYESFVDEKEKEIRITVEARTRSQTRISEYSRATALVKIEDVNDNSPVFVTAPVMIGYPAASGFDESVPAPLYKFAAVDADSGVNAEIVYSLISPYFYIDDVEGVLYAKRDAATECGSGCKIDVTAQDKGTPPRAQTQTTEVRFIVDEYVSVMTVSAKGSSSITPKAVVNELTLKLGYPVELLSASPIGGVQKLSASQLLLSIYAYQGEQLVTREKFMSDFDEVASSITSWSKLGEIRQPDHGIETPASSDDLLAATIALSVVLGLVIIGAATFALYVLKGDGMRRGSSTDRLESEGEESISSEEVAVAIMPRINEKELRIPIPETQFKQAVKDISAPVVTVKSEVNVKSAVKLSPPEEKKPPAYSFDSSAIQITDIDAESDEDYRPESPKPVKSAIKNSMLDEDDAKERRGGVRFDAEPEVFTIPERQNESSTDGIEEDVL